MLVTAQRTADETRGGTYKNITQINMGVELYICIYIYTCVYFWQARFVAKHGRTKGANGCPLRQGLLDLQCAVTVSPKAHTHMLTAEYMPAPSMSKSGSPWPALRARLKKKKMFGLKWT